MSPYQNIAEPITLKCANNCTLKNFGVDDLSDILRIERSASVSPWSEQNFRDSIASSHICVGFCVDLTDSPVRQGSVDVGKGKGENASEGNRNMPGQAQWLAQAVFSLAAGEAELLILSVDPVWQGKKIASSLLVSMEALLQSSARQVFLEVRESNLPAIQLYESLGYHQLGERRNYYPSLNGSDKSRETARLYVKDLVDIEFR